MRLIMTAAAVAIVASAAIAEDRTDRFCGPDHVNEAAGPQDVQVTPRGYYVASLDEQITLGDYRIKRTNGEPYFCTGPAVRPDMPWQEFEAGKDKKAVRWIFVRPHPGRTNLRAGADS